MMSSLYPTLTVGGNVSGNVNINGANNPGPGLLRRQHRRQRRDVSINPRPSALYVGGTVGNYNANGQVFQQHVAGLAASIATQTTTFTNDLDALSAALGGLATTGASNYNYSNPNADTFTAVDGGHGFAVINITGGQAEFANANNFLYNIPTVSGRRLPADDHQRQRLDQLHLQRQLEPGRLRPLRHLQLPGHADGAWIHPCHQRHLQPPGERLGAGALGDHLQLYPDRRLGGRGQLQPERRGPPRQLPGRRSPMAEYDGPRHGALGGSGRCPNPPTWAIMLVGLRLRRARRFGAARRGRRGLIAVALGR